MSVGLLWKSGQPHSTGVPRTYRFFSSQWWFEGDDEDALICDVRPDADDERLRKAFRKAAKAHHPDLHVGDPTGIRQFRQIAEANAVLRDPSQRAAYDRTLQLKSAICVYLLVAIIKKRLGPPPFSASFTTIPHKNTPQDISNQLNLFD